MTTFTAIHVILSLIGIVSGLAVLYGMIVADPMRRTTQIFLATTLATSLTGFFFPIHGFTPALGVGSLSVSILIAAMVARYRFDLRHSWRLMFIICAVAALYLNSFVLFAQAFLKIPTLHALAPTGSEMPFVLAQGIVLAFYLVSGALAIKRFRGVAPIIRAGMASQ